MNKKNKPVSFWYILSYINLVIAIVFIFIGDGTILDNIIIFLNTYGFVARLYYDMRF